MARKSKTVSSRRTVDDAREAEERLRAIVETAADAIITSDKRGIVKSFNRAAERTFGYSAEEVIGQNVSLLMPSPYREEHDGYIRRYLETGEARIIGIGREVTARRKDGSTFPIHLAVSEADPFGLFTGIIRDITQRKEAEESLRREHELSESMVNTAQNIVLVLDTEGRIVRFNPYMEELTGWRLDEVRGRDWFDTFLPERDRARIRELFGRAIRGERTRGNENPIVTKDGLERDIEWYDAPLTSIAGELVGLLCTGHDITERKRMERHLLEIAEEEQRRIGQDLHDDVGQQLTALSYLAHSLVEQMAEQSSPNLELVTKIAHGIRQTQERVRTVVQGLIPVELHCGGIVLALQQLAERTSETQKIACTLQCQKPVSIQDGMVATHLYHIAQEAITNAVRHGQASQIAVTLTATDGEQCLEIRDNGIGIAEPIDSASGHGLRIMAYRASIIGGTLTVRRGDPRGTVVTCTWRAAA